MTWYRVMAVKADLVAAIETFDRYFGIHPYIKGESCDHKEDYAFAQIEYEMDEEHSTRTSSVSFACAKCHAYSESKSDAEEFKCADCGVDVRVNYPYYASALPYNVDEETLLCTYCWVERDPIGGSNDSAKRIHPENGGLFGDTEDYNAYPGTWENRRKKAAE